jgi:hypothetical protein
MNRRTMMIGTALAAVWAAARTALPKAADCMYADASRRGSREPRRLSLMRAQSLLAPCCSILVAVYLTTPLRPFGEPGRGVFKYGKTGK